MGQSGSGKTTLLHIIAEQDAPDSGGVSNGEVDITRLGESGCDRFRARTIGYVFQTFNLLPGFSALENVLLGMTFGGRRADPARAKNLLDRVGLARRLSHKPTMLSVGEQQRVAVARAARPTGPSAAGRRADGVNVDRGHQQQIVSLIRETCREEGVALLLVTHTPEVADQFERVEHLERFNQAVATL